MEKVYEIEGILNKGFVGTISYNVCLDDRYEAIDVEFSFDKQRVEVITDEIIEVLDKYSKEEHNKELKKEDIEKLSSNMKTEIQVALFLNDSFIGGVHKQLTKRNMYISSTESSEGCISQEIIEGVLKINIIVFNVLYNKTHYTLKLKGNKYA